MFLNDTLRNRQADSLADSMDAGSGAGFLRVYGGAIPGDADVLITTQTQLAAVQLPEPAFLAAASGTCDKAGTWIDLEVDASGLATFFRLEDTEGAFVIQGTVGLVDSGAEMELDSTNLVAGGTFTVNAFSLTQPAN